MKLPERVPQHISETASFKLFSTKIPNNWIIRDVTERDYGIDCYLELVNEKNQLSGDLALIQLKSKSNIQWTQEDYYTISGINISTSNYWYQFAVPVFIFIADIREQEIYFIPVKHYIRKNFTEYSKQQTFSYRAEKVTKFEGASGIKIFLADYYKQLKRQQLENEMLFFLSSLQHFGDFQLEHNNRDFHLGLEDEDLIYFEAMHRNYAFLCEYFAVENPIPSLDKLKETSRKKSIGDYYELYEHDLTEWVEVFEKLTPKIITAIKEFIENEQSYWLHKNLSLLF